MADWVTISSLATGGGTLAFAGATFAATRSSNRAARIAEQALQEQRRPWLMHARAGRPRAEDHVRRRPLDPPGRQRAAIDEDGETIYVALGVRNAGAVIDGPATEALKVYEVQEVDGSIHVRA